jgi:hypothetical protein
LFNAPTTPQGGLEVDVVSVRQPQQEEQYVRTLAPYRKFPDLHVMLMTNRLPFLDAIEARPGGAKRGRAN